MTIRLLHLTDLHITAQPGARVGGVDPRAALHEVMARIVADETSIDRILLTGDLSDDGSPASYAFLRERLTGLGLPVHCVPGNHDDPEAMLRHLAGGRIGLSERVRIGPWQLLLLDSRVPDENHGRLSDAALGSLESALQDDPCAHLLVALHHGPCSVCPVPACRLHDEERFVALLQRAPHVRGVISGHLHCAVDEALAHVRLLVTPSTCVHADHPRGVAAPPDRSFARLHPLDPLRRGYRRLALHADGRIETTVVWMQSA